MVQVRRAFRDPSGGGSGGLQYGSVIATSAYDGVGRRITKAVTHSGDLDMTYHFYYSGGEGQSIIEIRNGSELVLKQHVWANLAGGYIDELIENDVNADPADSSEQDCELRGWACQDANYNVIGFVDDDLAVLERYEYTPYGQRVVFYSAGSNDPLAHTPTLIPRRVELSGTSGGYGAYAIGHQGLYHDEETGETLVYNRARMLHTRLGRWVQREPLGYVDGMSVYQYVRSLPITFLDFSGQESIPIAMPLVENPGDGENPPPTWPHFKFNPQPTMVCHGRDGLGQIVGDPGYNLIPFFKEYSCPTDKCNQDWLDCFNKCLSQHRLTSYPGSANGPALVLHKWPWLGGGKLGGASRLFTIPSYLSRICRAGARSFPRVAGRLASHGALALGLAEAAIQFKCGMQCLDDPCRYR